MVKLGSTTWGKKLFEEAGAGSDVTSLGSLLDENKAQIDVFTRCCTRVIVLSVRGRTGGSFKVEFILLDSCCHPPRLNTTRRSIQVTSEISQIDHVTQTKANQLDDSVILILNPLSAMMENSRMIQFVGVLITYSSFDWTYGVE